jgi:alpha-D-ribose 1-methylphosphonate 5-triphosphate synthase subunit PhnG
MRALALAKTSSLISNLESLGEIPSFEYLREPQKGLIMVRAKAGGGQLVFNLGEALVTRCSVTICGYQGHAYILGDEPEKCLAAALADALAQDRRYQSQIEKIVLALEENINQEKAMEIEKTQKTRVEFFTLVRGEDVN